MSRPQIYPDGRKPLIGITIGDINGIGPEITFAALRNLPAGRVRARFVIIGSQSVLERAAGTAGIPCPPVWSPAQPWPGNSIVAQWDPSPGGRRLDARPGRATVAAGRAAGQALETAIAAAQEKVLAGIVTAPVCKKSLHRAGWRFPGQTEWLAAASGTRRVGMLLAGDSLRVLPVTRHIPLAEVPSAITRQSVTEACELLWDGLKWLGIDAPRIGVCALNPHAGEGGVLGSEDHNVLQPTVRNLQRRGLTVEGPVAADIIFHLAREGLYDGIVAMYHDQGLAPLKTVAFSDSVNITLGLPFVRTSPDHGTAFDIAGQNRADSRSMQAAIRLAARLVCRPNPWAAGKSKPGNNNDRE